MSDFREKLRILLNHLLDGKEVEIQNDIYFVDADGDFILKNEDDPEYVGSDLSAYTSWITLCAMVDSLSDKELEMMDFGNKATKALRSSVKPRNGVRDREEVTWEDPEKF